MFQVTAMHFLPIFDRDSLREACNLYKSPVASLHLPYRLVLFFLLKVLRPLVNCYTDMTVTELRVHMDCLGCEKQVRKALQNLEGVDDVIIDLNSQKVTVMGWAKQKKILKAVRRNGRTAELWPYPYNPQYHGFLHHYQHVLNSPQHHLNSPQRHHHPQPQSQTKPIITYNSLPASAHKHNMSPIREYSSYNHNGGGADYGHHYQEPQLTMIDEEATAMFSDENPHSCVVM